MSTLIAKHNNGDLTDVDLKFHGEGAYRIRKSVPVFFVVRRTIEVTQAILPVSLSPASRGQHCLLHATRLPH